MSNLWQPSARTARSVDRAGRDHSRHVLERGAARAAPTIWMRQKNLGLWRSWTWNQTADAGARDRRAA